MTRGSRRSSLVASLLLLLALAGTARAAPAHDSFTTPHLFGPPGGPLTEDNSDSTVQAGEPLTGSSPPSQCPNTRMAYTLWYRVNGNGVPLTVITQRAGGSDFLGWVAAYQTSGTDPNVFNLRGCGLGELTFASVAGQSYLIQVGSSYCSSSPDACDAQNYHRGTRTVWSLVAPDNDNRANARTAFAGQVSTVADSRGATIEGGEATTCPNPADLEAIGKTVWFRYDAPAVGRATFSASGFSSPAIAVYRDGAASPTTCLKAQMSGTTVQVALDVTPGTYLIQVGGRSGSGGQIDLQPQFTADLDIDDDGSNRPADCNDDNSAIHPGAVDVPDNGVDEDCSGSDAVDLDRDRDTFLRPGDCNDANATIHPGAVDVPDNGVDEDCSGSDAVDLDRDRDTFLRPGDCNDANATIHPGAVDVPDNGVDEDCSGSDAVDLDRDRDTFTRPQDCRDDRADIRPGTIDTPGDRIDQDCDGFDAAYPMLASRFGGFFAVFHRHTEVTDLYISTAEAGSKLSLRCDGKGCPFKKRTKQITRDKRRVPLKPLVDEARFKPGAVLTVALTKPGTIGIVTRWKFRSRKPPKRSDVCKPPGATKPKACR